MSLKAKQHYSWSPAKIIQVDNISWTQIVVQGDLRKHFGVASPAVEHRAWQDVEVLSHVVQHLLCAGAAPDLQQYMQDLLKTGQNGSSAMLAGPISELLSSRQSGVCCVQADVLVQQIWTVMELSAMLPFSCLLPRRWGYMYGNHP